MSTKAKLFFDPLTPGRDRVRDKEGSSGGAPTAGRGIQTAAELKALRAASLAAVSRDLERMLQERAR